MSLLCMFGRHRPLLISIMRHGGRLDGLCEGCGLPLTRDERGQWAPAPPLAAVAAQGSDRP
jgi:hypothetical protein